DFVQFFWSLVGAVRPAVVHQPLRPLLVNVQPLALDVRSVGAADVRPFVPLQAQPVQPIQNTAERFLAGALLIGILDAQDELTTVTVGKQPVEQCGARAADVHIPRRTGRKTNPHRTRLCHDQPPVGLRMGALYAKTSSLSALSFARSAIATPG